MQLVFWDLFVFNNEFDQFSKWNVRCVFKMIKLSGKLETSYNHFENFSKNVLLFCTTRKKKSTKKIIFDFTQFLFFFLRTHQSAISSAGCDSKAIGQTNWVGPVWKKNWEQFLNKIMLFLNKIVFQKLKKMKFLNKIKTNPKP